MADETQIGWAILELMGHRKLAGFVTDDNGLLRIDVYTEDPQRFVDSERVERAAAEPIATQWYGRQAIYCITASTVDLCVQIAQSHQPAPVGRWELPERTGDDDVTDVRAEEDLAY